MPNSLETLIATVKEHEKKHESDIEQHLVIDRKLEAIVEAQERFKNGQDILFQWKKDMEKWKTDSDENYKDLKLTIVNENRDTQKYFREHMKDQFELLKVATQQRYEAEKQEASNTFEIKKTEAEIKKENSKQLWAFIGKMFATGGVGAAIILAIMNLLGITI